MYSVLGYREAARGGGVWSDVNGGGRDVLGMKLCTMVGRCCRPVEGCSGGRRWAAARGLVLDSGEVKPEGLQAMEMADVLRVQL